MQALQAVDADRALTGQQVESLDFVLRLEGVKNGGADQQVGEGADDQRDGADVLLLHDMPAGARDALTGAASGLSGASGQRRPGTVQVPHKQSTYRARSYK